MGGGPRERGESPAHLAGTARVETIIDTVCGRKNEIKIKIRGYLITTTEMSSGQHIYIYLIYYTDKLDDDEIPYH